MINCASPFLLLCFCIASTLGQKYHFQGKEYLLIKQEKTFDEANALCQSRSERLVQIRSQEEQDFVFNTIVKKLDSYVWLGATNVVGTKTFKWLGDGSELTFSNWYPRKPDNYVNEHNVVTMLNSAYDGKWGDTSVLSFTFYVICEQKQNTFNYSNKEFFVSDQVKGFNEAVTICQNRNQRLLQIKTVEENDFVFKAIVNSLNQPIWLGATLSKGTYHWLDGSEFDYSNLLSIQPSQDTSQQNAIYMSSNGTWLVSEVNRTNHVICESEYISIDAKCNATILQLESQTQVLIKLASEIKQCDNFANFHVFNAGIASNRTLNTFLILNPSEHECGDKSETDRPTKNHNKNANRNKNSNRNRINNLGRLLNANKGRTASRNGQTYADQLASIDPALGVVTNENEDEGDDGLTISDLKSTLMKQSMEFDGKIQHLDAKLTDIYSKVTTIANTLTNSYLNDSEIRCSN